MNGMIQITKSGLVAHETDAELEDLRARFDRQHCLRLRQFFDPALLEMTQRQMERAAFHERVHEHLDPPPVDLSMEHNALLSGLLLLLNDPKLFALVRRITGCAEIGCFTGSVYCMKAALRHSDTWHNDLVEHRLVSMSINMSTGVYSGGVLYLKDTVTGEVVHEVANTGFGDAIIFRLAPNLKHKLSGVDGPVDKVALAGWFKAEPDFQTMMRDNMERARTVRAAREPTNQPA